MCSTILDQGKPFERLALGGESNGGLYTVYRDPDAPGREIYGEGQWQTLRKLVDSRKPANIAIDISPVHAFSDGLTVSLHNKLLDSLGTENAKRLIHSDLLALEYQDMRVPDMLPAYREMMRVVHRLIGRAFSNEVITPGKTTDEDVVWWLRQQVKDMGYGTWFQPSVMIQRKGAKKGLDFLKKAQGIVIERGDVLHTDFGITAIAPEHRHATHGLCPAVWRTQHPSGIETGTHERQQAAGHCARKIEARANRQPDFAGCVGGHAPDRNQRNHLQPSHRRPRPRRRTAHRFMGSPGGCTGTRRRARDSDVLVLYRAVGLDSGSRVGTARNCRWV